MTKHSKIKIVIALLFVLAVVSGASAFAEEVDTASRQEEVKAVQDKIKEARDALRERLSEAQTIFRTNFKDWKASSTPEEIRTKVEALRTAAKKEIEEFKDEKKISLTALKKDTVKERIEGVFEKLEAYLNRLGAFDEKLETAIEKRKADNLDTSASEAALEKAREALESAQADATAIREAALDAVDETTTISKEALKEQVRRAFASIKTVRDAYKEAFDALPQYPETTEAEN